MSLLEVVFELTFIDSAIIVDPFAFALPHSVLKLAFVVAPIGPRILPETIRLTFGVISYIFISIDKKLFTWAVFQKLDEMSTICTDLMLVDTLAVLSVEFPASLVVISSGGFPDTVSIFSSVSPLSFEYFAIIPFKSTITLTNSIYKLSFINSIYIPLAAIGFDVVIILSLENCTFCEEYTLAIFHLIFELTKVDSFLFLYNFEVWLSDQIFDIEFLIHRLIIFEVRNILIFLGNDEKTVLLLIDQLLIGFWLHLLISVFLFDARRLLLFQRVEHSVALFTALEYMFG